MKTVPHFPYTSTSVSIVPPTESTSIVSSASHSQGALPPNMWIRSIAFLVLAYLIVSTGRSYWRLRKFKGPPLAAISDLWYIRAAISQKPHLYLSDVCTKYGTPCLIPCRDKRAHILTARVVGRLGGPDRPKHPGHQR